MNYQRTYANNSVQTPFAKHWRDIIANAILEKCTRLKYVIVKRYSIYKLLIKIAAHFACFVSQILLSLISISASDQEIGPQGLTCICSTQFANLRNFEMALRKLDIVKLLTNFEIAQPSLSDFEIALRKLETAKLRNTISKVDVYSNIKRTCTFP